MTVVIGIVGPAGSGKSTTAEYLARVYGAKVYAFATPLKQILQKAFDVPTEALWGTQEQKEAVLPGWGVSGRWLMQRLGTNGIRAVLGDDFWASTILRQIERDAPPLAVIEDVRFISEGNAIRWWREDRIRDNALIWTLRPPWLRLPDEGDHQSEAEWDKISSDLTLAPQRKLLCELHDEIDRACAYYDIKPVLYSVEAP